jgi:hypothetical protein
MNCEELIELARQHRPDPGGLGFETRLRARLRELRTEAETTGVFAKWLWRASWGLTPVTTGLAVVFLVSNGFSLPAGAESILTHLAAFLPGGTL